jgi:hypothetical protein
MKKQYTVRLIVETEHIIEVEAEDKEEALYIALAGRNKENEVDYEVLQYSIEKEEE